MLLTTLLALSTAAQAGAADWQLRATSGLWFVHNPAAGITLTAPELGVLRTALQGRVLPAACGRF